MHAICDDKRRQGMEDIVQILNDVKEEEISKHFTSVCVYI